MMTIVIKVWRNRAMRGEPVIVPTVDPWSKYNPSVTSFMSLLVDKDSEEGDKKHGIPKQEHGVGTVKEEESAFPMNFVKHVSEILPHYAPLIQFAFQRQSMYVPTPQSKPQPSPWTLEMTTTM
jgi:hypothetical protein